MFVYVFSIPLQIIQLLCNTLRVKTPLKIWIGTYYLRSKYMKKYVYYFGKKDVDGSSKMKSLLGGKGANLAEMSKIGIPVPPGFTISTDVCKYYYDNNKRYPSTLKNEIAEQIKKLEIDEITRSNKILDINNHEV